MGGSHLQSVRAAAADLLGSGLSQSEVARRIGCNRRTLHRWRQDPAFMDAVLRSERRHAAEGTSYEKRRSARRLQQRQRARAGLDPVEVLPEHGDSDEPRAPARGRQAPETFIEISDAEAQYRWLEDSALRQGRVTEAEVASRRREYARTGRTPVLYEQRGPVGIGGRSTALSQRALLEMATTS